MRDNIRRVQAKLEDSAALRYALAPVFIAVGLLLHVVFNVSFGRPLFAPTGLFLACIVAVAWYGGPGPGFLAALLGTVVLDLTFPPPDSLRTASFDLPRFMTFAITGLAVGWGAASRRRAEAALRQSEVQLRTARDELEMKVLEQTAELRESEEQWKAVFENNPTMYFVVDPRGTVLSVNPFGAEQLGYTVEELVGDSVMKVFYEADRGIANENIAHCFEQPGRSFSWELRKIRKNGSMLRVRETARAVLRAKGAIVLVACEDITERKRAEEALFDARAELAHVTRVATLGEMTASIAHEVNQPLAAIANNAGACLRWLDRHNFDNARRSVEVIRTDAHRAAEIIQRIRSFAKKAPPQKDWVNINQIVRDVIALAHGEIQRKGVSLDMQLLDEIPQAPVIFADRVQLQQVVLNLVMNAVEAMTEISNGPRQLLIRTASDGADNVVVSVRDLGPGIAPENLDRLFTPFYTTKPHGMGMGLAICRSIIEAHGGRLWATANDDHGATFQFTLPRGDGGAQQ